MSKPIVYTHIVVEFESQDYEIVYRASDGIRIGQREGKMVVYGENPHKNEGRTFLDAEFANRFIRNVVTAEDLKARGVELPVQLDMRQGEGLIALPGGSMELPGGIRKFGAAN